MMRQLAFEMLETSCIKRFWKNICELVMRWYMVYWFSLSFDAVLNKLVVDLMCFVLAWKTRLFTRAWGDTLSWYSEVARVNGMWNWYGEQQSQMMFVVVVAQARYSTIVDDWAIVSCFLIAHSNMVCPRNMQGTVVDFQSAVSLAQSELRVGFYLNIGFVDW